MAQDQVREFLEALFGQKPDRAAVQIWIRAMKPLTWFVSELDTAARLASDAADKFDVYVGCGIGAQTHETPQRQRLKADEVAGMSGVWADLDVNGGPDAKEGAAPSLDDAMELACELMEPTVLVSSGYGLQAWWLFDEPWMFGSTAERDQAKRIVGGYQGALRAAARRLGWGLDATQDLARVMRLPGTYNHKGEEPVDVSIVKIDGKRYQLEDIAELGQGFSIASASPAGNGTASSVKIRANAPLDPRFTELMQEEQDFSNLWHRKPAALKGMQDTSLSAVEWHIARWLVRAGLDDQEVADIVVFWRNKQEPGDPRKKLRPERISQTIGKVRATVAHELEERIAEKERDDAFEHIGQVQMGIVEPNEAKLMAVFNRIIGGPEIARLKQFTRDPIHARFNIELADGREVPLGKFDVLASQTQFRRAYAAVTGHYPPMVKGDKWDKAVAALLKAAHVVDNIEDSGVGQLELMIDDYFDYAGSSDKEGACAIGAPFMEDSVMHLSLSHFVSWLRRSQGERVERSDIAAQLRAVGYGRAVVYYTGPGGVRTSRSYFANGTPDRPLGRPRERAYLIETGAERA